MLGLDFTVIVLSRMLDDNWYKESSKHNLLILNCHNFYLMYYLSVKLVFSSLQLNLKQICVLGHIFKIKKKKKDKRLLTEKYGYI